MLPSAWLLALEPSQLLLSWGQTSRNPLFSGLAFQDCEPVPAAMPMCPWDSLVVASLENPQPGTSVGFFKHVGSKRVRKGNIFTWRWWCGVPPVPPRLHLHTPKEMPPLTDGTSLLTQSKPVGRKLKHPHTAPWRQTGHETCLNRFLSWSCRGRWLRVGTLA